MKAFHNSAEYREVNILNLDLYVQDELPDLIPPPGLSRERQAYLYTEIRPFCDADKQDLVCPAPPPLPDFKEPETSRRKKKRTVTQVK